MSIETKKDKKNKEGISRRIDTIFDNFRDELESTMKWPLSYDLGFPIFVDEKESRKALCDLIDKDDRYEVQLEMPGIDKKNIDIKATKNSIEVSTKQSEKVEEKDKNYIYNERSFKSVYRAIPLRGNCSIKNWRET
jgi:HSP20 family protein